MGARFEFAQVMGLVVRRWRGALEQALSERGLTYARWSVLHWTAGHPGGISQRALTEVVGVEPPVLSRHLDALEAQGLIRRVTAVNDRRANLVVVTAAAEPVIAEIQSLIDAHLGRLLADIEPERLEDFRDILHLLNQRLDGRTAADVSARRRPAQSARA